MIQRVRQRDTGSIAYAALGPADEAELIGRCRADDRAAHDELYHRFRRQVAGNLYRVLCDRTDLEDLVQEVFVIAFRGLSRFRGDARLSTWLYRICVNVALGRIRTRRRRPAAIGVSDLDAAATDPRTKRVANPTRPASVSGSSRSSAGGEDASGEPPGPGLCPAMARPYGAPPSACQGALT